jgi:hypothetical protein
MPKPTRRVPEDPGRPSPREAIAKATAAAGPKVAKAVEAATPKVEKAAVSAGKLLGTLRERAKITAKEFADAYKNDDETDAARPASSEKPEKAASDEKPRPRPRPSKD